VADKEKRALLLDPVDPHSDLPLFLQVVDLFESALRTGRLRAGQMLPTEAALCEQLRVSRKTLRRATDHLARLGLIRRMQGIGTVVTEDARVDGMSGLRSLHSELVSARRTPDTRLLSQERIRVDAELSRSTGFHVGSELLHLRRLRLADDEPYAILENLVVATQLGQIRDADIAGSFLEILKQRGFRSRLIRQEIEARMPTQEQSRVLGIDPSLPILCERIYNLDEHGEIFNLTTNYYHPMNYRMTTITIPDRETRSAG
jgi:DNA-binding GntR family transcriptional regulator